MKTLLLSALVLSITTSAHARGILVFKTVLNCQTYQKQEPVTVAVQEAQDGQSQLIIAYPLKQDKPLNVITKKTAPPKGMNGGSTKYAGINIITKEKVLLTLKSGVAPIKIGKIVGLAATLTLEKQDDIKLVCSIAK